MPAVHNEKKSTIYWALGQLTKLNLLHPTVINNYIVLGLKNNKLSLFGHLDFMLLDESCK